MSRFIILPGEVYLGRLDIWHSHLVQDLVTGLDGIIFGDLMDNIEWFFNLHDKNKDGFLTKDEVLTVSESLLAR
jgi:hypothetical protein